jgi:TolA-binding protein
MLLRASTKSLEPVPVPVPKSVESQSNKEAPDYRKQIRDLRKEIADYKKKVIAMQAEIDALKSQGDNSVKLALLEKSQLDLGNAKSLALEIKNKGCSCKGNCSNKICGCVKKSMACQEFCRCNDLQCQNQVSLSSHPVQTINFPTSMCATSLAGFREGKCLWRPS